MAHWQPAWEIDQLYLGDYVCIAAGSPAKLVKKRFDDETMTRLLSLEIYDWPEEKFNAMKDYLCDSNIDRLETMVANYNNT